MVELLDMVGDSVGALSAQAAVNSSEAAKMLRRIFIRGSPEGIDPAYWPDERRAGKRAAPATGRILPVLPRCSECPRMTAIWRGRIKKGPGAMPGPVHRLAKMPQAFSLVMRR
ncbi:hypothetical protein [Pelagivirga sediminicola]|uniref:hypothetical protein n=1 Tax=Pelagivirga sediminicola TaxID=2170575 RepID=UPI0014035292|nr:hypothetical protein [Pelagivirga sediminicola]